ncbi:MAG: DUF4389 domain-containing protein [Rubrimonas sp.]
MTDQTAQLEDRPDPVPGDDTSAKAWPRLAYMVGFAVMGALAQNILYLIALLQIILLALTKSANPRLTRFADSLGQWQRDVAAYQGCATEDRPFPWAEWPTPRN